MLPHSQPSMPSIPAAHRRCLHFHTPTSQMSFGELDPWMGSGVVRSPHNGVPTIVTERASHRQDLSAVQAGNSAAFNQTQATIKELIRAWVIQNRRPGWPRHPH